MENYVVKIKESLIKRVLVKASSETEAIEKVTRAYLDSDLVLSEDNDIFDNEILIDDSGVADRDLLEEVK